MQKITLHRSVMLLALLIALTGCVEHAADKPTPAAAQQLLKLRGYEFDEKSFRAAASGRDMMAINAFFDAGINPNAQDEDGRTALVSAAARGDLEVVNLLVQRGADVNIQDKQGKTALLHAIEIRNDEVADVLLNHPKLNPDVQGLNGVTALISYTWRDRTEAVQKLVARGANVNLQDNDGDAALHGAAQSGNMEILTLLLDKGANPNLKNKLGGTPLMWAAVFGNEAAAVRLLERGAQPSLKDAEGMTALDWAVKNKRENVVALLRRYK